MVTESAETLRLDPEYFQKIHLNDDSVIRERSNRFANFSDFGLTVDASAFYPSIEPYYGIGNLPFLRVADVDRVIDFENCTRIPEELVEIHSTLNSVSEGDIVLTKGGSVARSALVTRRAAVSRDLIFINASKLPDYQSKALSIYFQTKFFQRLLVRSSSQTAQPHLTLTLVKNLAILKMSENFSKTIAKMLLDSNDIRNKSIIHQEQAEALVLSALGLEQWQPPEALTYERSVRDVIGAGRLDAEFFKLKYTNLVEKIRSTHHFSSLGDLLSVNERGKQPLYSPAGYPVVNSKYVTSGEVRIDEDNRFGDWDGQQTLIQKGDVLINGTGVGTIGRAAPYLHNFSALPDNHVTILRPRKEAIDSTYLAVFLNSMLGQMQVSQRLRGSSGQIELYPTDVAQFTVWIAPDNIQLKIRELVENSKDARQSSFRLLEAAKRAVEIAIEDSETVALKYLSEIGVSYAE